MGKNLALVQILPIPHPQFLISNPWDAAMFTKQSISLLACSAIMLLPVGIATAGEVDLQTDNARVLLDRNGGIIINSSGTQTTITPNSRVGVQKNQRLRSLKVLRRSQTLQCRNRVYTENRAVNNRSGATVNRTYSSTTTTTCQ